MNHSDNTLDIEIRSLLHGRRIHDAISRLENAALHLSASDALDEIHSISQSYGYLSGYALDGVNDPARNGLLDDIMASLAAMSVRLKREMLASQAPTLYFNTLRTLRLRQASDSLDKAVADYRATMSQMSMALMAGSPVADMRQRAEMLEKEIFNHVWTIYPMRSAHAELIRGIVTDDTLPSYFKQLVTGAVFMGLDGWIDEQRIMLLADIYESADEETSLKALTALILGLWIHRDSIFSRRLANRLAALSDSRPDVAADIREVVMQIIRTRDTDRVTRKITDEVIPEMMKLRPDIEKSMKQQSPEAMLDPEANPEWEEMLEKSGMADKLRELQEMQEEGADVMMSTFGRLKTFPFFNDIANWFMPFHTSHSAVSPGDSTVPGVFGSILESNPMFCDNDKYSFILSIAQIPVAQRSMVESQIEAASDQFRMMQQGAAITGMDRRKAIIRNFTRDLYRFFKLFRRKGEFNDPFASPLNPSRIPLTGDILDNEELLTLIGQFYFKNRYWAEAYEILSRHASLHGTTPEILQKLGYSLQQQGLHDQALEQYQRSEMLGDSSKWLTRRIAACHKALGNHREALDYLRRLEQAEPDDMKVALGIGQALMKLNRFDEALKYFYKVDYSHPGKADRLMAWSTFMTGDYEKSASLWDSILASSPGATDYMNAGHLSLVTGDYRRAASLYSSSVAARDFNLDAFMLDFAADRDILAAKGVDPFMEGIVLDEAARLSAGLGSKI